MITAFPKWGGRKEVLDNNPSESLVITLSALFSVCWWYEFTMCQIVIWDQHQLLKPKTKLIQDTGSYENASGAEAPWSCTHCIWRDGNVFWTSRGLYILLQEDCVTPCQQQFPLYVIQFTVFLLKIHNSLHVLPFLSLWCFSLTEGIAGLHSLLLPLDQLENYSAYEILYTSALSITLKQSISLLQQICCDRGSRFIYFLVLPVIAYPTANNN